MKHPKLLAAVLFTFSGLAFAAAAPEKAPTPAVEKKVEAKADGAKGTCVKIDAKADGLKAEPAKK